MPGRSPAKRRRDAKEIEEDENPKDSKNQKIQTTPAQKPLKMAMTNPPPIRLHSNPKVSASAVKGVPPPPIEEEEEENGDDDDMVPPTMVNLQSASSTKATASTRKTEASDDDKKESVTPVEDEVPEETEGDETASSGGGTCFNFLLVFLLIGLGCSAGFVHQRIVQDLQTQLRGYQQDLQHTESKMIYLMDERNGAIQQKELVRTELIDLVYEIRYFARQQLKAK